METVQCGGSTTKEDSGGTTEEDVGITVAAATVAMIMPGIAAGGIIIPEMAQKRASITSRIGRRSSDGTTNSSSNINSRTTVAEDGRETPEEEDFGMVEEEVRKMIESRVPWETVVRSRNTWNLLRHP